MAEPTDCHCRIGKVIPKNVVGLKDWHSRAALKKELAARGHAYPSNPDVEAWLIANPWFRTDPALNELAIGVERALCHERPLLSDGERLDEVSRELRKRYPEKFA